MVPSATIEIANPQIFFGTPMQPSQISRITTQEYHNRDPDHLKFLGHFLWRKYPF